MNEEIKTNGKDNKRKPIVLIAAVAVVILAAVVGIGIYNAPSNRIARQMDLGYKYLENGQYEEAVLAFEQAIAIDARNMEAYAGALKAYAGKGDKDELASFYDKALDAVNRLDDGLVAQYMDYIVEIYLATDTVYESDVSKIIQVLEEGYGKTGQNEGIKSKLVKAYMQAAKGKTDAGAYEEALAMYDRLIELDGGNKDMISDLCVCLNKYIDLLIEQRDYGKIRALAEKYKGVADGVDFDALLAKVTELEAIEAENRAFMQKVYDLMAAGDYEAMHVVYSSEETAAFVERMGESDRYIYFPDNNASRSGKGAGVYKYDERDYCFNFYYGDIDNGIRKGIGTQFESTYGTDRYLVFEGQWDKDAPNGEGVFKINDNGWGYNQENSGILMDGLWNGDVKVILTDINSGGEKFDLSFSAKNGIPTQDRTEEGLNETPLGVPPSLDEGMYFFAYDYHQDTGRSWWQQAPKGSTIGVCGFADVY